MAANGLTLNPKTGFDLGWDYAHSWVTLPETVATHKDIVDGFNAARARKVKVSSPDRFIRKWLLLRFNAWKRNRIYSAAVTPEYLKFIDTKTCPVTGVELTHGTGADTDWSIDRINNDAAYVPGNLVIVSTRANVMKGAYSFAEMSDFAFNQSVSPPGDLNGIKCLSSLEWARWAFIASHAVINHHGDDTRLAYCVFPCIAYPPTGCINNASAALQAVIARRAKGIDNGTFKAVLALIPKQKRKSLNEILRRAEKVSCGSTSTLGIWLNERLFGEFAKFFVSLPDEMDRNIMDLVRRRLMIRRKGEFAHRDDDDWSFSAWGADTLGYAEDTPPPKADQYTTG